MSLAALAWAAILGVSASLNGARMPGSMLRAMRDLNLPAPLMRPFVAWAHLLIQVILALGLVLAPRPYSWIFTSGLLLLASTYLVVVWRSRGHMCRCLSRTPHTIGPATITRNMSLFLLAVLSLDSGGLWELSATQWPALIVVAGAGVAEALTWRTPQR
ncbi:MauE/DoxX family redox-associated membrane protein [Flaviflexus huanghaiensis]|uniref:MauE/DoxX family redox-associated membrane protein n=1 Tax=Flaviflexus huanghaiensis TaxID=1111473 RepID=UPI0015FB540A|nr:MauE/DoxX family redox-associated membrane protein [Flaviflexus huanghaiensis]